MVLQELKAASCHHDHRHRHSHSTELRRPLLFSKRKCESEKKSLTLLKATLIITVIHMVMTDLRTFTYDEKF